MSPYNNNDYKNINFNFSLFDKYKDIKDVPMEELVKTIESVAKELKNITTNQVRNVFGSISTIRESFKQIRKPIFNLNDKQSNDNIEMEVYNQYIDRFVDINRSLILLKPSLSYIVGKAPKNAYRDLNNFKDFMISIIDKVNFKSWKSIDTFFVIVESFVAFHKFHEPKKN